MFLNWKSTPFWAAGLLYLFSSVYAQEKLNLSLDEALKTAREKNYDLMSAHAELDAMQADKNKSLAAFLPSITLSETYVRTNDPLNVFGLKLKQEIVNAADFNPALLNNPDEIYNYNTKAEIQQPLINLDAFFGRAAAADGLSAMKHKLQRTKHYIDFMVKTSYYELTLQTKSLDVIKQSLSAAKANRDVIRNYFEEGMISKADYLMAEIHVSNLESRKAELENSLKTANGKLLVLLGLDPDKQIIASDSLVLPEITEKRLFSISIVDSRSDILARSYKVSSLKKMNTMSWTKFLPRLNAFGNYEFNDSKLFGTSAENWMVGLNLQWNVFNGFQNIASIQKSQAELKQAEAEYLKAKAEGENELNESFRMLETAKKKLALARTALLQSEESLRIINDRYKSGLEKTSDLLNAESSASNTKLNYLKSLYFYNVSVFKIELMSEQKIKE